MTRNLKTPEIILYLLEYNKSKNQTIAFKKLLLTGKKLTSIDINYLLGESTAFTYYKIHMEDVSVESVQESASSERPAFSISLHADRMAWLHCTQNPDGSTGKKTSYGWDNTTGVVWPYVFK